MVHTHWFSYRLNYHEIRSYSLAKTPLLSPVPCNQQPQGCPSDLLDSMWPRLSLLKHRACSFCCVSILRPELNMWEPSWSFPVLGPPSKQHLRAQHLTDFPHLLSHHHIKFPMPISTSELLKIHDVTWSLCLKLHGSTPDLRYANPWNTFCQSVFWQFFLANAHSVQASLSPDCFHSNPPRSAKSPSSSLLWPPCNALSLY